jgi:NSS family neurotransmitter:Na+ symporter
MKRERWNSKFIFVLAAVGSAVGLGNVWRFPYLVGKYGGGSFLIPYLIMLLLIGVPLMILEFSLGQKMQKGAVKAFGSIRKGFSSIGYAAILCGFFIITYYTVIISWCVIYFFKSINLSFRQDTQKYFFENVLHLTPSVNQLGTVNPQIVIALLFVWAIVFLSVYRGVKSIAGAMKIMIPVPFLLIVVLMIRGLTLPGALQGVLFYLKPDFIALFDVELWTAAIAQAFFSLSLGFGVMVAYASFEAKKDDITKNAFTVSFFDFLIALISGFAVFSTLGFMASQSNVHVSSLAAEGPGLAFIVFPQSLLLIPGANLFSMIFFFILVMLGLSSAVSMIEAAATPITDVVGERHEAKVTAWICIIGVLIGLIYTTGAGMYFLDIVDHFVTSYPLLIVGLFECIAVGWFYGTEPMRKYANSVSKWKLGKWWSLSIKYLTPALLIFLLIFLLVKELTQPYGDYPGWALMIGWGVAIFIIVASLVLHYLSKKVKVLT